MESIRLAIICTHPIQYNAPLFSLLAQNTCIKVKVFYTLGKDSSQFTDPGFRKPIKWDVPLLNGYEYTFVKNTSANPTTSSFRGIINPTLIQEIENFYATHILIYGWSFQSHLNVIRYFHNKVKIIFRGDSTLLDERYGLKTLLRRLFLTWVYSHLDTALYVGKNNKEYFLKHGVPERKLLFAPHAIDNERYSSPEHEFKSRELKQKMGIDLNKTVFLFTGKFESKKNPSLLLDAFLKIKPNDSVLLMVGNGALEQKLKQSAAGNDYIKFLPFQNQSVMPSVYRLADVLVLPSQGPGETWGLSINEAMACGLAIIASNKVGGAIDLIDEGMNGFIFESQDKERLIEIIMSMAKMPKLQLKRMGQHSKIKIKDWSYLQVNSAILRSLKA